MKRLAAALVAAFFVAQPVMANWLATPQCRSSDRVATILTQTYGETIQEADTRAFPDGGPVLFWVVWANEENGSWSLTFSNGPKTCLAAMGTNYSGQALDDLLIAPGELL